jgi:hypothetical protein
MMFRNYMGFLAVLNMLCLLQAYVFEQPGRWRQLVWMVLAGIALGSLSFPYRFGRVFHFDPSGSCCALLFRKRGGRLPVSACGGGPGDDCTPLWQPARFIWMPRGADMLRVCGSIFGWMGMVRYLASQQIAKSSPPPANSRLLIRRLSIWCPRIRRLSIRSVDPASATADPVSTNPASAAASNETAHSEKKSRPVIWCRDYLQRRVESVDKRDT